VSPTKLWHDVPLSRHDKLCTRFKGYPSLKIWEDKKTSKIGRDLGKLLSLSANGFKTDEDIDKL